LIDDLDPDPRRLDHRNVRADASVTRSTVGSANLERAQPSDVELTGVRASLGVEGTRLPSAVRERQPRPQPRQWATELIHNSHVDPGLRPDVTLGCSPRLTRAFGLARRASSAVPKFPEREVSRSNHSRRVLHDILFGPSEAPLHECFEDGSIAWILPEQGAE
jgi:hypothetical protein